MGIVDSQHGSRDHLQSVIDASKALFQSRIDRYKRSAIIVNRFEVLADWVLQFGQPPANDAINFKEGNQGIKWTSINAVQTSITYTPATPINALGHHWEVWCYVDNVANLSLLQFYIDGTAGGGWTSWFNGSLNIALELRTGWNKLLFNRRSFSYIGSTDVNWGTISAIRFRVTSVAGTTVNVTFDEMLLVPDRFKGKVTLRFDDGNSSQYTAARPRMDAYGFRGVICNPIIYYDVAGSLTKAQAVHLQERGWDIIDHSVKHDDWTTLTARQLHDDCIAVRKWLIENGFIKGSRFAAAPYWGWNYAVLDIVKQYFLGCQCVGGVRSDVIPPDINKMYAQIVTAATPVATVQTMIDYAIEVGSWLTLTFHRIVTPAAGSDYTPANFQLVLDYLYNNNVEVVTFSDVFDEHIGSYEIDHAELLFFGVQGVITPNATSYPCPGGGLAAQTANEIAIPISKRGWLKNLRVRQRVASGAGGRTDIYTIRVNGAATALTCTLDNVVDGSDLTHTVVVNRGDRVSASLVSNNAADTSADVEGSVELQNAR